MPKAWGYIRVSTVEQADGGVSLEQQRAQLLAEIERKWKPDGFELGGITADPAVSGSVPFIERKGGAKLLYALDRGDVVLFPRLDRGFRNTRDALATIELMTTMGVRPVFMDLQLDTGTPVGKFVVTIMAGFAEMERAILRQRISDAVQLLKANGHTCKGWFGVKFIGRTAGKKKRLMVNEDQYAFGLMLLGWRVKGYTYEAIAAHLQDCGVQNTIPMAQARRYRGFEFTRDKRKFLTRWYAWRDIMIRCISTARTTQAIKDGKVGRELKLPPGVAIDFGGDENGKKSLGRAFAGEPVEGRKPQLTAVKGPARGTREPATPDDVDEPQSVGHDLGDRGRAGVDQTRTPQE